MAIVLASSVGVGSDVDRAILSHIPWPMYLRGSGAPFLRTLSCRILAMEKYYKGVLIFTINYKLQIATMRKMTRRMAMNKVMLIMMITMATLTITMITMVIYCEDEGEAIIIMMMITVMMIIKLTVC